MERWGLLLAITGGVMMAVSAVVEFLQWYRGYVPPAGFHRIFFIGVVLMALGAAMMGLTPVPGGL
jgi:hypothetical protein